MKIRVLGPIEAEHEGRRLKLGGPKQRLVLGILLAHVNEVASTDRIIEEVWLDTPPRTAHRTVQAYVSSLRQILEPNRPGTLSARAPGYIIEMDAETLDAVRFEELISKGRGLRSSDPESASRVLREAEGLWRGEAYADLAGSLSLIPEINRLSELRLIGVEGRIDADLALGMHAELVPELEALVDTHPLREGLRAQLMTALYRSGRQAEALRVYQRTRRVLGEELGIEPSPELRHLEGLMLVHDTSLSPGANEEALIVPVVRYATTQDGVSIAHYAIGSDDIDLVYVPGWVSNIETMWEHELPSRFLCGLASFSRLICFDKRGTGLSDRVAVSQLPDLATRAEDVQAVLDAVGSERAVLFGVSEGGPIAAHFAATHSDRTLALILYGSYAARKPSPEYPWAPTAQARNRWLSFIEREWGGEVDLRTLAPSMQNDPSFRKYWSRYLRSGASPTAALALGKMNTDIDIRELVFEIKAPTLVLHRTGDLDAPVEGARWLAHHIPNAELVEFEGTDHLPQVSSGEILEAIRSFLSELSSSEAPDP